MAAKVRERRSRSISLKPEAAARELCATAPSDEDATTIVVATTRREIVKDKPQLGKRSKAGSTKSAQESGSVRCISRNSQEQSDSHSRPATSQIATATASPLVECSTGPDECRMLSPSTDSIASPSTGKRAAETTQHKTKKRRTEASAHEGGEIRENVAPRHGSTEDDANGEQFSDDACRDQPVGAVLNADADSSKVNSQLEAISSSANVSDIESQDWRTFTRDLGHQQENMDNALAMLEAEGCINDTAVNILLKLLVPTTSYVLDTNATKRFSESNRIRIRKDLKSIREVVVPMCANSHWVVAFADTSNHSFVLLDSMDEKSDNANFAPRLRAIGPRLVSCDVEWTISNHPCPQQQDLVSCGIHVIVMAFLRTNDIEMPNSLHALTARTILATMLKWLKSGIKPEMMALPSTSFPHPEPFTPVGVSGTLESLSRAGIELDRRIRTRGASLEEYHAKLAEARLTLCCMQNAMRKRKEAADRRVEALSPIIRQCQQQSLPACEELRAAANRAKESLPSEVLESTDADDSIVVIEENITKIQRAVPRHVSLLVAEMEREGVAARLMERIIEAVEGCYGRIEEGRQLAEEENPGLSTDARNFSITDPMALVNTTGLPLSLDAD